MFFRKRETEVNDLVLHRADALLIFLRQFKNPLLLILFSATVVAFFVGERTDALVILGIMAGSVLLGFGNEWQAERTVADLLRKISVLATVVRNGQKMDIPARNVVVGDMILLTPGAIVPADLALVSFKGLEINEAVLSGESMPVVKGEKDGKAYMGTVVVSGSGSGRVVAVGKNTRFGKISLDLTQVRPETEFQKGLRNFGVLLLRVIVVMAAGIFLGNFLLGKPLVDSALFSLAIAIGLTPELLPMVVTVSLSSGARLLAKKEVIVKRLVAIEDLGNMEVLCTDKTGTLTEGRITLEAFFDGDGKKDERIVELALWCNSAIVHHRVFGNPIDAAIWQYALAEKIGRRNVEKIDEGEFDWQRRAMFTVVREGKKKLFIYKGAPEEVLTRIEGPKKVKDGLLAKFKELSREGLRVVAVASREIEMKERYGFADAERLHFSGFLTFSDRPKSTVPNTLKALAKLGVAVKILTGDNELVTRHVCSQVGIDAGKMVLGAEVDRMNEEELVRAVWKTEVFARVTPDQKERIIKALQIGNHTVGFLGDGINDGPALHLADVGISVNTGVDVAKDAASIVLLQKSLAVITDGVVEGRRIFQNTIKYILMGTSSNFGNMFSAAGASFLLPFLPMMPSQILLTNVLYDVSQLSIPTDNVDPEALVKPRKWDISQIKRYMVFFGPLSSVYDFLTFGVMLFFFQARNELFQTGWFVESLVTEVLVVFVIRTARPFFASRPSGTLLTVCLSVVAVGVLLPFTPLAPVLSFVALPPLYFLILIGLTVTYLGLVEVAKKYVIRDA